MSTQPRISVLIPVYNAERYLCVALESVIRQTCGDFEVVAVNDGSTDSSARILEDFANSDSRIRVISRPNTGLPGALNDGLSACTGEFVARMDADDICFPTRFQQQLAFMRANPDCIAVGCHTVSIDPDGRPLRTNRWPVEHTDIEKRLLQGRAGLSHPGAFIRVDAIRQVEGYLDLPWGEDIDLFLRLGEQGRLASIPEVLLYYRIHPESVRQTCGISERLVNGATVYEDELKPRVIESIVRAAYLRRGLSFPTSFSVKPRVRGQSEAEWHYRLCSMALKGRSLKTARHHGVCAIAKAPFVLASWRILLSALLGRKF